MNIALYRITAAFAVLSLLLVTTACGNEMNPDTTTTTITSTEAADTTTTTKGSATTMTFQKGTTQTTTKPTSAPSLYGVATDDITLFPFYRSDGNLMASSLQTVNFIDEDTPLKTISNAAIITRREVTKPNAQWRFTHESAIAAHDGVIYCCWYNNAQHELSGFTPIRGSYSTDGGKTWSTPTIWAQDTAQSLQYAPPRFGKSEGKLYLLVGLMSGADNMVGLNTYVLNPSDKTFSLCRTLRDGIKLNNNVLQLPNGKLITAVRVGNVGHASEIPAVWISDNGKVDSADWRVIKVANDNRLPNGTANVFPENALMRIGKKLYMFVRNDGNLVPLVYISDDYGETWSDVMTCDIPFYSPSMIAAGTLSDGRGYIVANVEKVGRAKLVLYLTDKNSAQITKELVLFDAAKPVFGGATAAHYPSTWEDDGKLYISATVNYDDPATTESDWEYRGAAAWVLDISKI